MKSLIQALTGGVAVMLLGTLIGVAHNALRSDPVQLVPRTTTAVAAQPESLDPAGGEAGGSFSVEAMARLVDEGVVVVIDARGPGEYAEGHIPGAINIPYEELENYLETLLASVQPDQPVVCYCTGPHCDLSDNLARELGFMGYQDVRIFRGGWEDWTGAGHEVITGTEPE